MWWSLFIPASGHAAYDVYAAAIPTFPHQPAVHVNYQESTLPIEDGLPKLQGFPVEMGGSGELLPEWSYKRGRIALVIVQKR